MLDPDKTLSLAVNVAAVAEQLDIRTALIGAAALAVHGYARGTEDIDLAACVRPLRLLKELASALDAEGLGTELRMPDDEDPLGGVLVVWHRHELDSSPSDVVEVVNFLNPVHLTFNPAARAISRSTPLPDIGLRCVTLADLIALKLYAGGSADLADIVELLARNRDADLNEIRAVASPFDEDGRLEALISEAFGRA